MKTLETTNINSTGKKDANDTTDHKPNAMAYELFIALTGVISITLILWHFTLDSKSEIAKLINYFDAGICVIFFADFLRCLIKAPNKRKYFFAIPSLHPKPGAEFVGWGFLDLAASIPVIESLRFTRLARICRVFRIIRLMKGFKILLFALRGDRRVLLIVAVLSITMTGLIGSTFLVLYSESQYVILEAPTETDGILTTAHDTMWWSLSTVLTGGCEVFDPVTTGGRVGAIILKLLAVTVLAAMMGLTCGWVTKILAASEEK